jgi:hypothetical protein
VVRAGRLRGLMILSRKRYLPSVMALPVRNWGPPLWTRAKGTQGRTADAKEPSGIENRHDGNGDGALAESSNPHSELLMLLNGIYGYEVAVVNRSSLFPTSRHNTGSALSEWKM